MSASNQNFPIRQCTGAVRKKRRYTPKSSWDNISSFVSEEVKKGTRHRTIIAKLSQLGVSIEEHQFKRLVEDLGVSGRNIRQKHRKYIFQTEQRARQKGLNIRRWRFKDTGQVVKQTQLDRIRKSSGAEFEKIISSPGELVPSPSDVLDASPMDLSISEQIEETEEEHTNYNTIDSVYVDSISGNAETTAQVYRSVDPTFTSHKEGILPELASIKFEENTERVDSNTAKDGNEVDEDEDEIDENHGVSELETETTSPETTFQLFCEDMLQCIESSTETHPSTLDQDILDGLTPQELVEYLSQIFRPDLERWKLEYFSDTVEEYKWNNRSPQDIQTISSTYDDIIQLYYDMVPYLWRTIGSESATLRLSETEGELIFLFDERHRRIFRQNFVHLPYLRNANEYGLSNFVTLYAMLSTVDILVAFTTRICLDQAVALFKTELILGKLVSIDHLDRIQNYSTRWCDLIWECLLQKRLQDATKYSVQNLSITSNLHGGNSIFMVRAAVLYMSVWYSVSGHKSEYAKAFTKTKANLDRVNRYVALTLRKLQPLQSHHQYFHIKAVYTIMQYQICMEQPGLALRTARLAERVILTMLLQHSHLQTNFEIIRSSAICWEYQLLKAEAHSEMENYTQAINSIKIGLDYLGTNPLTFNTQRRDVINLSTTIMTSRGIIRYTEPMLERVLRICEEKNNAEQNPYYRSLLFAVGSAAFQLYIEEEKQIVSRITLFPSDY